MTTFQHSIEYWNVQQAGLVEEQIPNSYYLEFGEGKYLGTDTLDNYTVVIRGLDYGTFTLEIEEVLADSVLGSVSYKDIPITPSTIIEFTIQNLENSSDLTVDIDGDGSTDFTLEEGEEVTPLTQLKILKGIIKSFNIRPGIKRGLIERIDSAIKLFKLGKTEGVRETLTSFQNQLKALAGKKLSAETSVELIQIIEIIKSSL